MFFESVSLILHTHRRKIKFLINKHLCIMYSFFCLNHHKDFTFELKLVRYANQKRSSISYIVIFQKVITFDKS